jgi:hypothetical protein
MDLAQVLEDLYKSEINFDLSTFWDRGYIVRLGDPANGFKESSEALNTLDEVARELIGMTRKHYPDSEFASKYCPLCNIGFGPGHNGSSSCESGSIASGGNKAHCTCDTCF